jgi:aminoglycoside phosphotransferase (APT) family kinase protein
MLDEATPLSAHDAVPLDRLTPWLEGVLGRPVSQVTLGRFGRGYSNLTFSLDVDGEAFVLRRPPPGVKIQSAHDMGREARIVQGVGRVWSKVPQIVGVHDDPGLLGGGFYLMRRMTGVILRDRPPEGGIEPATMRRISEALVDTAAEIHGLDVAAMGLSDLGRPEGYALRQVEGWTGRWHKARTDDVPAMDQLAARLLAERPPEQPWALIHNDLKYDNVLLDPSDLGVVSGVLDWEMATLGDVWMDLGTVLSYWVQADDPAELQAFRLVLTHLPGNLTRDEVVARYSAKTGRECPDIAWYYAFGLFKTAVVAQQLYARFVAGLTTERRYAGLLHGVRGMSAYAGRVLEARRLQP